MAEIQRRRLLEKEIQEYEDALSAFYTVRRYLEKNGKDTSQVCNEIEILEIQIMSSQQTLRFVAYS